MAWKRRIGEIIYTSIAAFLIINANSSFKVEAATFLSPTGVQLSEDLINKRTKNGTVRVGDMLFAVNPIRPKAALNRLWPNGRVYYSFSAEITASQRSLFRTLCVNWAFQTPLTCIESSSVPNYILVRMHDGNAEDCPEAWTSCSHVGMKGGVQNFWVYRAHWNAGYASVIQHEIGHAIGMLHEHQRSDAYKTILINHHNIDPRNWVQFDPDPGVAYTEYDSFSIMHYDNCELSIHGGCAFGLTPTLYSIEPRHCHVENERVGGSPSPPSTSFRHA